MSEAGTQHGSQIAVTVPLFLRKLWKMVNDEDAQNIISWNSTGDGFIIHDPVGFITNLLPHYFKHNNLASFVRQLNFYDFHKVASPDKDEMHFAHSYFLKDLPETLVFITRKATSMRSKSSKEVSDGDIQNLLDGVKEIKGKHVLVDKELDLLKEENSALWNEINCLRVKYSKQTKIINRLIHFLISYIHSHQNVFKKQNTGVNDKNISKNLLSRPSLLEIDYKGKKIKSQKNNSSLNLILNQPSSSSSAFSYPGKPTVEEGNLGHMELLNSILTATDDTNVSYSVQFPKSPDNSEFLKETTPIIKAANSSNETQPKRIVQLNKGESLEDIFLVKDAENKAITYSVKYPKPDLMSLSTLAKSVEKEVHPQLVSKNPTSKINRNQKAKSPKQSSTVTKIVAADPNTTVSTRIETKSSKTKIDKEGEAKPNNLKRSNNKESEIMGCKERKLSISEKVNEKLDASELLGDQLQVDELLSDPTIVNAINTIPAQKKTLEVSILDNPKENLGIYIDNTETEINNLQDILNNMNAKEWANLLQDFSPSTFDTGSDDEISQICDVGMQEEMNAQENNNVAILEAELANALLDLPEKEIDENIANNDVPADDNNSTNIVDEYFNPDFEMDFPENV